MRAATKAALVGLLAVFAAPLAQAGEQHGGLTYWRAVGAGQSSELRWTHEATGALADGVEWKLEPELMLRQPRSTGPAAPWNNRDRPPAFSLQRAYIGFSHNAWLVRVGKQAFDWSQTDTISPADLVSPRDWSDITRVRKLAAPAVSVRYGGATSLEAVWLPRQQPSYPPEGDWLPLPAGVSMAKPQPGQKQQFALRAAGNWRRTDWSAVLYRGHSVAPALELAPGPTLQPVYRPLRAAAITAAREVADGQIARLEIARYHQPDGTFVQYVASLDKEVGDWLSDGDTLYVIAQYADGTDRGRAVDGLGWPDFRRVLERSVMVKASYDPRSDQRTLLEFTAVWNVKDQGRYAKLAYQRRLGEALTLSVAGEVIDGPPASFWGRYQANDRATLELSWRY